MRRVVAVSLAIVAMQGAAPAAADELVVIVHRSRQVALDIEGVAQVFLKRRRFWEDGSEIVPLNHTAEDPARTRFDRSVFGERARRRLASHWNRAYFQGVLPPATLASHEAVLRFVASEPRAIGYVLRSSADESVRIVLALGDDD